jgi:capsid protein
MSINEMGMDEEEVDRQIARDNERADELGLVLDSDPRKTQGQLPSGAGSDSERDVEGGATDQKRGKERVK